MRILLATLALVVTAGSAVAVDCEKFVKVHAFLSRAQFQCGFSKYSEEMLAQARDCGQHMGEKRLDESLASGMKLFDQRERERGHAKMCAEVLESFPQAVAR